MSIGMIQHEGNSASHCWPRKMGGGPRAKACRPPLDAETGKEADSPPRLPRERRPADPLILAP